MDAFDRILGTSAHACAIRSFGRQASAVDATVFLTGETGTGKGVLARAIHDASARRHAAFIAVNCAGVPDALFESEFFGHVRGAFTGALQTHRGWFEQADRGTLFLDELAELTGTAQAKLLTALDDGELRRVGAERSLRVNSRIIAASNVDPTAAVRERRLRIDLYHRLRVLTFQLPPLRARKDDIAVLAHHYVASFAAKYARPVAQLTNAALDLLCTHDWPGNVRELAHTIEAALLARPHNRITTDVLEPLIAQSPAENSATAEPGHGRYAFLGSAEEELTAIRAALRACRGNKTRAARRLGMSRNTLLGKLRRFPAAASHFAMESEPPFHHREPPDAQLPRDCVQLHTQPNRTHERK